MQKKSRIVIDSNEKNKRQIKSKHRFGGFSVGVKNLLQGPKGSQNNLRTSLSSKQQMVLSMVIFDSHLLFTTSAVMIKWGAVDKAWNLILLQRPWPTATQFFLSVAVSEKVTKLFLSRKKNSEYEQKNFDDSEWLPSSTRKRKSYLLSVTIWTPDEHDQNKPKNREDVLEEKFCL